MGFDIWLVAEPDQANEIPSRAQVEAAFDGLVLRDDAGPDVRWITVGTSGVDSCEIHCSETDPQVVVTVSRPVASGWLWDRIYQLLTDFDMFLWWGDEIALLARDGVPTPAQMALNAGSERLRAANRLREHVTFRDAD